MIKNCPICESPLQFYESKDFADEGLPKGIYNQGYYNCENCKKLHRNYAYIEVGDITYKFTNNEDDQNINSSELIHWINIKKLKLKYIRAFVFR